jgi:hypothetical protein
VRVTEPAPRSNRGRSSPASRRRTWALTPGWGRVHGYFESWNARDFDAFEATTAGCLLRTGSDWLGGLALYVADIGLDFTVVDAPEFAAQVRRLAESV